MKTTNQKPPSPKEIEKELGQFLAKKFGASVKMMPPVVLRQEAGADQPPRIARTRPEINFDLTPVQLVAYLNQYIIGQQRAKAVLATKVCTHFNRVKYMRQHADQVIDLVGGIKNNILMIGPTGVGKTYMIKLIAKKLGVPFVKGDATKFSETGYVGGDVEDLVRDLVREADDDIELAQCGIIYIDEIDKIAGSPNHLGADISRTGVQRALLKPMEETDVELKVPHDPVSMIQEIERYRKTGSREKRSVNTRNILFIMSGAFNELDDIIRKRLHRKSIGFSAKAPAKQSTKKILQQVISQDLTQFGFESEFVGRLPVRAIFSPLDQADLYKILSNPNNPVILGKKYDFAAYNIDIKFDDSALHLLAKRAYQEHTGARGLINAIENALLPFENRLSTTALQQFPVTADVIKAPHEFIDALATETGMRQAQETFNRLGHHERKRMAAYLNENAHDLTQKINLTLTDRRIDIAAAAYAARIMDTGSILQCIKSAHDELKSLELNFLKQHDINIVFEQDAVDMAIERLVVDNESIDSFYMQFKSDFEFGLKLLQEKTGRGRFFITSQALADPESFVRNTMAAHFAKNDVDIPTVTPLFHKPEQRKS